MSGMGTELLLGFVNKRACLYVVHGLNGLVLRMRGLQKRSANSPLLFNGKPAGSMSQRDKGQNSVKDSGMVSLKLSRM